MLTVKTYITGPLGVNTYLGYDETHKAFIVDPGGYSEKITEFIRAEDLTAEYILLTHGHGDHIGGVDRFREDFPDIKVVAYEEEKEMLSAPFLNASLEILGKSTTVEADLYVMDGDTMTVGNTELTFIHTPGHTRGGMCIIASGCVFSGDTLFKASIGRTDCYGGSFARIMESIRKKLFILPDDTTVYPGHGGITTIGYEKRNNPFV